MCETCTFSSLPWTSRVRNSGGRDSDLCFSKAPRGWDACSSVSTPAAGEAEGLRGEVPSYYNPVHKGLCYLGTQLPGSPAPSPPGASTHDFRFENLQFFYHLRYILLCALGWITVKTRLCEHIAVEREGNVVLFGLDCPFQGAGSSTPGLCPGKRQSAGWSVHVSYGKGHILESDCLASNPSVITHCAVQDGALSLLLPQFPSL